MGVTIFRPGQRLVIPSPGVQVWSPRATIAASTWWDNNGAISGCVAAYAPKGAASLAASYINLANPGTYNAAPGVAPTFNTVDGWTFNGTTQYLSTGIIPSNVYTWSVLCRFSNGGTGDRCLCGTRTGSSYFFIRHNQGGTAVGYYYGSNGVSTVAPGATSGVLGFAGTSAYRNGVLNGTITGGTIPTFTHGIYIGGYNSSGSFFEAFSGKIQALAIYSTTLTAGEVATLTTLMNAI